MVLSIVFFFLFYFLKSYESILFKNSNFTFSVKKGGKVWVLDRNAFEAAVLQKSELKNCDEIDQLRRISIFNPLPKHILSKISQLIQVVSQTHAI